MGIIDDEVEPTGVAENLARARAGDSDAFCRLMEPLQSRLFRQAVALSYDVNVAEDLVAETTVEAWKSLARYDENCRLSTWLYAILLHRYQKWRRRARSRPIALAWLSVFERTTSLAAQEMIPAREASPDQALAEDEAAMRLREQVARLPEKLQQVVLLRFFEDASLEEISRALGCPVGTVKSRLHHALEKLRRDKLNPRRPKGDTKL